jgi:hypothetical protein
MEQKAWLSFRPPEARRGQRQQFVGGARPGIGSLWDTGLHHEIDAQTNATLLARGTRRKLTAFQSCGMAPPLFIPAMPDRTPIAPAAQRTVLRSLLILPMIVRRHSGFIQPCLPSNGKVAARQDRGASARERIFRGCAQQSRAGEREAMIDREHDVPTHEI